MFPPSAQKPIILSMMLEDNQVENPRKILLIVSHVETNSMILAHVPQRIHCIMIRRAKHGVTSFLSEMMPLNCQSRHF